MLPTVHRCYVSAMLWLHRRLQLWNVAVSRCPGPKGVEVAGMRGVVKCLVALAVINGATWVYSQGISSSQAPAGQTLGEKPRWKAENGLLISWVLRSKDATTSQVEVFDESGHSLAKVKTWRLLRRLPAAQFTTFPRAVISDCVAAGSPGGRRASRSGAAVFDFNGSLRLRSVRSEVR